MTRPILVVTSRYPKAIDERIERDHNARRNPSQFPFSRDELLSAAEGADALFISPADRPDSGFFQKVSPKSSSRPRTRFHAPVRPAKAASRCQPSSESSEWGASDKP
jgi:hypothetical protein